MGQVSILGISTSLQVAQSGDQILIGTRFFALVQTGPRAHPAYCTMGSGLFHRGKVTTAWH